jgi:alpha-beta hydrolase superfamily lysophospholipase
VISALLPTVPTLDISQRRLTHDQVIRADRATDDLVYRGRVLARTGNEMRRAGDALLHEAHQIRRPLYIIHGTADELADWRASLALFGRAESEDKQLTLYRGLFHETLNEVGRDRILASLADWIEGQLDRLSTPPRLAAQTSPPP